MCFLFKCIITNKRAANASNRSNYEIQKKCAISVKKQLTKGENNGEEKATNCLSKQEKQSAFHRSTSFEDHKCPHIMHNEANLSIQSSRCQDEGIVNLPSRVKQHIQRVKKGLSIRAMLHCRHYDITPLLTVELLGGNKYYRGEGYCSACTSARQIASGRAK